MTVESLPLYQLLQEAVTLNVAAHVVYRLVALAVGVAVMLHFVCMSILINGRHVPALDALVIAITGASGFGTALHAIAFDHLAMLHMLAVTCGLMICFLLLIWHRGFYVSAFYQKLTQRLELTQQ